MSEQLEPSSRALVRILIFGGTFDPPHLAHAKLPAMAARQLDCDEIVYVPAAINPLKGDSPPTAKEHRLAMLLLAIADVPNARISTIELDREGLSYTIDTLRELHRQYNASSHNQREPQARKARSNETQFFLLIGADQALDFHRWKDWQAILELATPAVMLRPPWNRPTFEGELRKRFSDIEVNCWLKWTLNLPLMDLNATEIRERFSRTQLAHGMVDSAVIRYICRNNLYK